MSLGRCLFCYGAPPDVRYLLGVQERPAILICDRCVIHFAQQVVAQKESEYQKLKEFAP